MFDQSWPVSVQLPDTRKVNKLTKYTPAEGVFGVAAGQTAGRNNNDGSREPLIMLIKYKSCKQKLRS